VWSSTRNENKDKNIQEQEETKTNASAHLVQSKTKIHEGSAVQMEPERLWRKEFVEQMSFKSGMKD